MQLHPMVGHNEKERPLSGRTSSDRRNLPRLQQGRRPAKRSSGLDTENPPGHHPMKRFYRNWYRCSNGQQKTGNYDVVVAPTTAPAVKNQPKRLGEIGCNRPLHVVVDLVHVLHQRFSVNGAILGSSGPNATRKS